MNSKKSKAAKKDSTEFVKLYVPELLQLIESGDEKTCLVWAQCEYWFGHKPDGFYKFMSPAKGDNSAYRDGDSWTEEMGMSDTKINNAFKPICTHYRSFTAYKNEVGDKFKGKFYCSYYHKPSHQTYYLRDHDKTNAALKSLSLEKRSNIFREKHSSKVGNDEKVFSGDAETSFPDIIEGEVIYTETTTKNNQENNTDMTQEREDSSHFFANEIKKEEEENKNVMQEEEDVYEPSTDNVDCFENGVSALNPNIAWQSQQEFVVPFPSDFELTEEMVAWAENKKPEIDVHDSTDKFKIYHADNLSKHWLKKWQIWIRNERTVKGTSYTSGKKSRADTLREVCEYINSGQSEQVVNETKPVTEKTISPEIIELQISDPNARAILMVSYETKQYLMHRDLLSAAYEDFCSGNGYKYSRQTFEEGLKYLCDEKIFQSYFKDYFINLFEFKKSLDWRILTWKEILETNVESSKEIITFITENVLILDDVVEEQFSNINVKDLELFLNANVNFKLLRIKNHYFYNAEQYNSNPGYKEEVDKKMQELGLLDNQEGLNAAVN
ncbi:MAG: hypothetical protein LC778_19850 [Acidobacteria bacterium]|nr:hypothetical protein [Acidobacteriota bacterium]